MFLPRRRLHPPYRIPFQFLLSTDADALAQQFVGWLLFVGFLELQVSFAKDTYKRDDILQKRPID